MVEVKTTNPANGYVMGHAQGMHAIMVLTSALWSDKTKMAKCVAKRLCCSYAKGFREIGRRSR